MARELASDLIFIGIKGSVVALDRASGAERWRTNLKGSSFVNVALESGGVIFAATRGEIFCLDPFTGQVYWNNPLKGMGYGLVTIAGTNILPMVQQIMDDQAAAAAASSSTTTSG
jgi:outer membrane protein assembly factor BamB